MQTRSMLILLTSVLAFVAGLVVVRERADAVGENVVYVSGLRLGKRTEAIVRIHNPAPTINGTYTITYLVRESESGRPLSRLGAAVEIRSGETLELDIGQIVKNHLSGAGVNPNFSGPVQFVAFNNAEISDPFGPETAIVTGIQTEGKAAFSLPVIWQSAF